MLPSSLLSLGSSKPDHHLYMFIQIWLLLETLVHVQGTLKGHFESMQPQKGRSCISMGPQTQLYSYLISNPPTDHPGIPGCVAGVVCCLDDRPCFPGHGWECRRDRWRKGPGSQRSLLKGLFSKVSCQYVLKVDEHAFR